MWATTVGPGGDLGGMEFGSATDGERIYAQLTNFGHTPFQLTAGAHAGETTDGGIWAALDAATGKLVWQLPDVSNPSSTRPKTGLLIHPYWGSGLGPGFFAADMARSPPPPPRKRLRRWEPRHQGDRRSWRFARLIPSFPAKLTRGLIPQLPDQGDRLAEPLQMLSGAKATNAPSMEPRSIASPVPTPRKTRFGLRHARVAKAWATTAG